MKKRMSRLDFFGEMIYPHGCAYTHNAQRMHCERQHAQCFLICQAISSPVKTPARGFADRVVLVRLGFGDAGFGVFELPLPKNAPKTQQNKTKPRGKGKAACDFLSFSL
jgi:hypothetical protein